MEPYRPFDLIQSGIAGLKPLGDEMEANAPENPLVVQYIKNALTQAGVPPEKQGPHVQRALGQLSASKQAQPGQNLPPVAAPGIQTPGQTAAGSPILSAAGGPAPAPAAPAAPTRAEVPFSPTDRPASLPTASRQAQGLGLDAMQGGIPKNTFEAGPAQQKLDQPVPRMFADPAPQSAPAAQPPQGQRISRTSTANNPPPEPTWTKRDTARVAPFVQNEVQVRGRDRVAQLNAEAKAVIAEKNAQLRRELTTLKLDNSNSQLSAKLEQGAQLAMSRLDVQQQNAYFDFASDLIRAQNDADRVYLMAKAKEGDWEMELLKIQQRMQASKERLIGQLGSGMNLDRQMRVYIENLHKDAIDIQNNTMRGADRVAGKRGDSELIRPQGATNSRGDQLQQGTEPAALPAPAAPAPAPAAEPPPQAPAPRMDTLPEAKGGKAGAAASISAPPPAKKDKSGKPKKKLSKEAQAEADELNRLMQ